MGTAAVRASRARGLGQPEGRFCCHEQRAMAVSGDGGEVLGECITAVLEHRNEDSQSDFVMATELLLGEPRLWMQYSRSERMGNDAMRGPCSTD